MTPDTNAVRAQLERILASGTFATAGRHSRVLRYIVERTLAGEGEQLKEYVLGTEVFDRPDSYDPRLDSIVRVEARRLRSRLEEYYRREGSADSVVITIPRGSYVPGFALPRPTSSHSAVVPERRAYSPVVIVAAASSVAIVVLAAGLVFNNNGRVPARASPTPDIAVLPFEHYSTREEDALYVAKLTDAVTAELAQLGTVSVASRTSASRYATGSVPEIAKALKVEMVVEGSVDLTDDRPRLTIRLVDARLDRKVWVGEYVLQDTNLSSSAQAIAAEAAAATLKYVSRR